MIDSSESDEEYPSEKRYKTHDIPPEVRNFIGVFGSTWKTSVGKVSDFERVLSESGFFVPHGTISRWISLTEKGVLPVTGYQGTGRTALLSEEQQRIIVGGIFCKNELGEIVVLESVIELTKELFNIEISTPTASRLLKRFDLSNRKAKRRQGGFIPNFAGAARLIQRWIQTQRNQGYLALHHSLIGSIDFTYSSRRTMSARTFAASGG